MVHIVTVKRVLGIVLKRLREAFVSVPEGPEIQNLPVIRFLLNPGILRKEMTQIANLIAKAFDKFVLHQTDTKLKRGGLRQVQPTSDLLKGASRLKRATVHFIKERLLVLEKGVDIISIHYEPVIKLLTSPLDTV
jgi:hypothetical protein